MSEKKSWIARLLGKPKKSDCCAVRIEEVAEVEVAQKPTAKPSACCAVRIEAAKDDDVSRAPPVTR